MIAFNNLKAIRKIAASVDTPYIPGLDTCVANVAKSGRVLGGAFITNYTGPGGSAQVTCAGFSANWMTRQFLFNCAEYAFNTLKVGKIVGIIPMQNSKALALDRRLGFREECVIQGLFTYEGKSIAGIVLSMTKDRCRFLDHKYLRG